MQRELFETDIGELPLLFGMMKVGRRLLHCKLHLDAGERHRQHSKSDWSPIVDPSLQPEKVSRVPAPSERLSGEEFL